ncbi:MULTISPECIES: CBS domain-containing protein [Niallia]|jgi:DeoR family transcriptional regulator, catabolite repression regulator|uniref:Transcriptional repressor CcpN n=1 Tax=Niallia circulans TaxID=1397 RepID=A0A268F7U2_NIACI|nr:CBS domain-containing protein [Niallia circulans]AYV69232.1 CBS domain-containing protein [Niallia circulans]AYV72370.1 CBS domain-containing protein [Niallia circulans]NRG29008.1 CBS domain-containing protein [Niallia circulans]PAD81450.1 transcriptional repressor CcpN [Niallia circulans]QJX60691.1 CBS domain-containing protein [Niallia circulans]
MKLSERQEKIIKIVKEYQPVSGEKVSDLLDVSRATLRSDLSFLTLVGILQATPKIGYTYSGSDLEKFFFFKTFNTKVNEIMMPPLMVNQDTSIRDAITTLFMYDVGSLYVTGEEKLLLGVLSRKDLLRASLNTNIDQTPVAVCMTRVPHIKVCKKDMDILEAASILQDFEVDSLPVVDDENERKVIGKITKTRILNFIIQQARKAELNE